MRWCRNPYAPLDQGLVNAGHPEARQKRPSIASTSAHAADTRGWVDRRSRQGYFLVGRSPLNAGFARPLAARPRSPTLPSGANSGLLCGMPNSAPKLAWFLHTRTPPGGLFSGGSRGFGSMALTGPSLARRRISLGGAETDLRLTLARPDGCGFDVLRASPGRGFPQFQGAFCRC